MAKENNHACNLSVFLPLHDLRQTNHQVQEIYYFSQPFPHNLLGMLFCYSQGLYSVKEWVWEKVALNVCYHPFDDVLILSFSLLLCKVHSTKVVVKAEARNTLQNCSISAVWHKPSQFIPSTPATAFSFFFSICYLTTLGNSLSPEQVRFFQTSLVFNNSTSVWLWANLQLVPHDFP